MKWLFMYAHPDDESVAAGGTIRKLVDFGDEVMVVLATYGDAGKVHKSLDNDLKKYGSVSKLRKKELEDACEVLGVGSFEVLDFLDGGITNEMVWEKMTLDIIDILEKHKPDVLVTFDHTGWYFHLDHIGVSIATMRAFQQSSHKVESLVFNPFHPPGIKNKWNYSYSKNLETTHRVNVSDVMSSKVLALKAHASQDINLIERLEKGEMEEEYFEVVAATKKGEKIFRDREFFVPTS